jgi:butyrate kinase
MTLGENMYDLHRCLELQLRAIQKPRPTLIMPEADDARMIEAAERLTKYANIVLLTTEDELKNLIRRARLGDRMRGSEKRFLSRVHCVNVQNEHHLRNEFAQIYHELGQRKKWGVSIEEACEKVRDPVFFSVLATRCGYADMVIGGTTHSSREFLIPCLRLLERQTVVYAMALFALPGGDEPDKSLVMFADVALNPVPTPEALARIAIGSCKTLRDMIPVQELPEINCALLSYSTRGSGEGPSVERVRGAAELIPSMLTELRHQSNAYETINISTELQISVAVSLDKARSKLGQNLGEVPAAGKANVLIAPNLDVGNLLYHFSATRYPESPCLIVIGGIHNRALDFSRSSSVNEIVLGAKGLILRFLNSRNYQQTPKDLFFPRYRVLTINPGSTSTKVALFEGEGRVFEVAERHDAEAMGSFSSVQDQFRFRLDRVHKILEKHNVVCGSLHAVVGRGGLVHPLESGTYRINEDMLKDLNTGTYGEHPSNLGAPIAKALADKYGSPAFVVDPPVVDELDDVSRITGLPGVKRRAAWHALNQKAVAKRFADERGLDYEKLNLIVAHLGGGVSVGAHRKGRCVFVRDALYDGPMTPNRSGTLPQRALIDLCYSGIPKEKTIKMIVGDGGLAAHLGTTDFKELLSRVEEGDPSAVVIFEAMVQQVAMEISAMVPLFRKDPVDRIIITGGMSHSARLIEAVSERLSQVAGPLTIMPGEDELEALRDGALRVLALKEPALEYRQQIV